MKPESPATGLFVAVVDDDDIYRERISHFLDGQGKCRVFQADGSVTLIEVLDKHPIDCIVLDYNLGNENGLSIGEMIKNKYSDPPPIVMLTGEGKERIVVKAFHCGFSDYVSKRNLNLDELADAITGAVRRKSSDRAEREERNRLARFSSVDGMTGLHTHSFIMERAEELATSARHGGAPYGLVIIRVDKLESIGAMYGHVIRDRALRAFAIRLKGAIRETDICGQYAERGFLYLIDRDLRPASVIKVCERLSGDLSFEVNFDKASFKLAPRIGAALFPLDGTTVDQLLAAGESALERAQSIGARFALASPPPPDAAGAVQPMSAGADLVAVASAGPGQLIANRLKDRRCEPRQRCLKRGQIVLRGIQSVFDCTIRDISSRGARLRVDEYFVPPEQFDLLIVESGVKKFVGLRWRVGNDIGVQFLE